MSTDWIHWITPLLGDTVRETCAPCSPDLFYCSLEDLPLHLIPRHSSFLLHSPLDLKRRLMLNPHCQVLPTGVSPDGLADLSHMPFALHNWVAWVENSETGVLTPFLLNTSLAQLLDEINSRPHEPVPWNEGARLLYAAGVLVDSGGGEVRLPPSQETIPEAAKMFRERGYAPVGNLIHPFQVAALRRYYRHRIRVGAIHLGDEQSSRRFVVHNDPVASFFHRQLVEFVGMVVGESVKPSYVYLASYLPGAELRKHKDREQCEFSVTFCLDFAPEPIAHTPWPIQLETAQGNVAVYQALGDGLVYRGTQVTHYRSKLAQGQTSTSIFFHYVPADFTGDLD